MDDSRGCNFVRKCFSLAMAAVMALLVIAPAPAHASRMLYELTGSDEINFLIDTDVLTLLPQPDGVIFQDVQVEINSVSQINDIGFVYEYNGGGFLIFATSFDLLGPVLYTGPTDAPILLSGQFNLTDINDPNRQFSLQVTDLDAVQPVPEPATWLTLILGFFLIGGILRYRRRAVSAKHLA